MHNDLALLVLFSFIISFVYLGYVSECRLNNFEYGETFSTDGFSHTEHFTSAMLVHKINAGSLYGFGMVDFNRSFSPDIARWSGSVTSSKQLMLPFFSP